MRSLLLISIGLIGVASAVHAQTPNADDGEVLQRALEDKAVRIPASDLAAALSAGDSGRSDRARTVRRLPDWAAVREDLQRTSREDAAGDATPQETRRFELGRGPDRTPPPGLRAFAAERMARVENAEVDRVLIPLLAPAHPDVRDKIKVYGQENTYTAAGNIDPSTNISISGACDRVIGGAPNVIDLRKRLAKSPRRLPGLLADYHISRNEFGADLSFSKFGCGYVLTIECGDSDNDDRCTQDSYITMLARSMLLLNSERAGGGQ